VAIGSSSPGREPLVVLIAGPNGAGKSTSAPRLLAGVWAVEEFVNADEIASGLSGRAETVAVTAGRTMLDRLRDLAAARKDFAFETTLASRMFVRRLARLREEGYRSHLLFLSLPSPEMAVARVAERVRSGGHDVPAAIVRRRFRRGLWNLVHLYADLVDSWQVFDNAGTDGPRLVAERPRQRRVRVHDQRAWRTLGAWTA
jgi:predicted ABC-type ATPase